MAPPGVPCEGKVLNPGSDAVKRAVEAETRRQRVAARQLGPAATVGGGSSVAVGGAAPMPGGIPMARVRSAPSRARYSYGGGGIAGVGTGAGGGIGSGSGGGGVRTFGGAAGGLGGGFGGGAAVGPPPPSGGIPLRRSMSTPEGEGAARGAYRSNSSGLPGRRGSAAGDLGSGAAASGFGGGAVAPAPPMPRSGGIPLRRTISSPDDAGRSYLTGRPRRATHLGHGYGHRGGGLPSGDGGDLVAGARLLLFRTLSSERSPRDGGSGSGGGGGGGGGGVGVGVGVGPASSPGESGAGGSGAAAEPLNTLLEVLEDREPSPDATADDVPMLSPPGSKPAQPSAVPPPLPPAPEVDVTITGKWKGALKVRLSDTVVTLLDKIATSSGLTIDEFKTIFKKHVLNDMDTRALGDIGIKPKCKVVIMKGSSRAPGSTRPSGGVAAAGAPPSAAAAGTGTGSRGGPSVAQSGTGSGPTRCRGAGCQFFGSAARNGYCSGCFKKNGGAAGTAPPAPAAGSTGAHAGAGARAGSGAGAAPGAPQRCKGAGCQFFGSDKREGYCSSCYAKVAKPPVAPGSSARVAAAKAAAGDADGGEGGDASSDAKTEDDTDADSTATPKKKKKKDRCGFCRIKLHGLGLDCQCGKMFCHRHYNPADHECTFDHKERNKEVLKRLNKKVVSDRLQDRL